MLRGHTELVQSIANLILGTKGVQNGKLVLTVAEYFITEHEEAIIGRADQTPYGLHIYKEQ